MNLPSNSLVVIKRSEKPLASATKRNISGTFAYSTLTIPAKVLKGPYSYSSHQETSPDDQLSVSLNDAGVFGDTIWKILCRTTGNFSNYVKIA